MKALKIQGGRKLKGTVRVSGAKNSSVALIPAAILSDDVVTICNVPEITDITITPNPVSTGEVFKVTVEVTD